MAYGNAQRLGETIDPRLMQADFSGYERAGATIGNALANIGQQIGAGIKQNNENQKEIAGKIKMAEAMKKAVPGLGEMADKVIADLTNPELSTRDKLRASAGINEAMQVLLLGNQENRANASLKVQQDQLGLEAAKIEAALNAPKKVSKSTIGLGDGSEMDVLIDEYGKMTDVFGNPIGGQGTQGAATSVQNGLPPQNNLGSNLPNTLKPFAGDFQTFGSKYKVDPNLLAAIAMHETGNGTSSAFRNKNNAMGVSNESGPIQMGSVPESIERMARLLGQGINEGTGPYAGVKSIGDIASIYAPQGAGNDPNNLNQNWTSGVTSNLQKLTQNADANGIANASQPQYGVRKPKSNVSIPQEVTLPDGTKAYGSFVDSKFVPATVDGKPMARKLPIEEMTIEENILSAPISIALLRTTPYGEMANQLEKQLNEAKASGNEKAIAQISTYANTFLNTMKASPLSADSGRLSKAQEKMAGQEEIAKLIARGDKARALMLYNSLAIGQGVFGGGAIVMQDFDSKIEAGEFNLQEIQDQTQNPSNQSGSTTDNKLNELKSQF